MNIEKALNVFHDEILYLQEKEYPEWMIKKKAEAYNSIVEYISTAEMESQENKYKFSIEINNLKLIIKKLEGICLAVGVKIWYLKTLNSIKINHLDFLIDRAIQFGYFNKITPLDLQMGYWAKNNDRLFKNLDYFIDNNIKPNQNQLQQLEKLS